MIALTPVQRPSRPSIRLIEFVTITIHAQVASQASHSSSVIPSPVSGFVTRSMTVPL